MQGTATSLARTTSIPLPVLDFLDDASPAQMDPRTRHLADVAPLSAALPLTWKSRVTEWLADDMPSFDIQGCIAGSAITTAVLLCKSDRVIVAGFPFFSAVFEQCQCSVEWQIVEGSIAVRGDAVAHVVGRACDVLRGERTALELFIRCTSIATRAKAFADVAANSFPQFKGRIAGTRKTTPGLRLVEKYALMVAGVDTHRLDLSHMVMLKDNHIDVCQGNITLAVTRARELAGFSTKIEVECRTVDHALEAAHAGADVVMLDNFAGDAAFTAAERIKAAYPHVLVEVSGGIRTEEDLAKFASPHVDVISMGTLTQSVIPVDFSLKVRKL